MSQIARTLERNSTGLQDLLSNNSNSTPGRWQSKTSILSMSGDKKSLETGFWIAICCPNGNKWQIKTLFLTIFDPRFSIV